MTYRKYLYSALLLALSGAGCEDEASEQDVEQIVRDAVAPSTKIRVTPTSGLGTSEYGVVAQFSVELTSAPTADVSIRLFSSDESEGLVDKNELVFTPEDFGARIVTVTGVDDGEADGNMRYQIILDEAVSEDLRYQSVPASDVSLINSDDDEPGVTVLHEESPYTSESGATSVLNVRLNTRPSAPVRVPVASLMPSEGVVDKSELWFLPREWDVPQDVTVSGIDDPMLDGDRAFEVAFGKLESADYDYLGLDPGDIPVVNHDDDEVGVRLKLTDASPLEENSEDSRVIEVVLTAQPASDVTIQAYTSSSRAYVSEALLFSPEAWDVPQTFTVRPSNDDWVDGDAPMLVSFYAASDDVTYSSLTLDDIAITVSEDDVPQISASTWRFTTCEAVNGSCCATLDVSLNAYVTGVVTLSAKVSDATEGKVDASELVFDESSGTWRTLQVCGVDDNEVDGPRDFDLTLSLKSSEDPLFTSAEPLVLTFTNEDNDVAP